MSEATAAAASGDGRRRARSSETYAALDLGTNNCRLLIASPTQHGFRILEAYSRIVRLGEGMTHTGRLDHGAMERALSALKVCADKLKRRRVKRLNAVATQACRLADNGREFIERVATETGLKLRIISPREEARLSVAGCLNLLDPQAKAALVVDVGGGSTELSWVDLTDPRLDLGHQHPARLPIHAWTSIPMGVVTLAERFPEGGSSEAERAAWYRAMVEAVKAELAAVSYADRLRPVFAAGDAHLVGTSGAITSLAGLHLGLPRYERARVDGLWMSRRECEDAADHLLTLDRDSRAAQPCIGPDRADLVLAGAAVLQAVQELWPCASVRVADRGLREGLLMSLMNPSPRKRGRRRRGSRPAPSATVQ